MGLVGVERGRPEAAISAQRPTSRAKTRGSGGREKGWICPFGGRDAGGTAKAKIKRNGTEWGRAA